MPPPPPSHLPVVYSPAMVSTSSRPFAFSASKPQHVAAALRERGWPLRWVEPEPIDLDVLRRVHDPGFVDGVLSMRRPNGFGSHSESVARSLPYTCGGFHTGALWALREGLSASLTNGFHHAHHDHPRGFCTFNGLVISAVQLLESGRVERVAIIDCDYHYGDGTQALLEHLGLTSVVLHVSFGETFKRPDQSEAYLAAVDGLRDRLAAFAPGVIFYQAGADTHVDDPLGGLLTTAQMRARDRSMFASAAALGIPLTWNLAGGYQQRADGSIPEVVQLHLNTFEEALEVWSG